MIMLRCDICAVMSEPESAEGWYYGFANRASMAEERACLWVEIYKENAGGDDRFRRNRPAGKKLEHYQRFDACSRKCLDAWLEGRLA